MSEIRQIQLDGINYDLVITEDEVAATRAEQAAQQATQQAAYAGNYAVQAEDAADRAEQIVGGQFVSYGGNQGLSDTQKEQARKNIAAGGTNPNLLDNPFFTVRQRGDGPFSGANTFAMDRWRVTSNSTITCTTNGITITTTVKKWGMQYRVPKDFFTVGKAYTISALEQDGTITNATFTWTGSGLSLYPTGSNVGFEVSTSNGSYDIIYFTTSEVGSVYLRAVKLELGTVSTLANNPPPDFGEELAKCQRYLYVLNAPAYHFLGEVALAGDATNCTIGFHLPAEMRTTAPSVTLTSGLWVGGAQTTAVNWTRTLGTTVVAACTVTGGLSGSTLYAVATGASDTTIIISAEL